MTQLETITEEFDLTPDEVKLIQVMENTCGAVEDKLSIFFARMAGMGYTSSEVATLKSAYIALQKLKGKVIYVDFQQQGKDEKQGEV